MFDVADLLIYNLIKAGYLPPNQGQQAGGGGGGGTLDLGALLGGLGGAMPAGNAGTGAGNMPPDNAWMGGMMPGASPDQTAQNPSPPTPEEAAQVSPDVAAQTQTPETAETGETAVPTGSETEGGGEDPYAKLSSAVAILKEGLKQIEAALDALKGVTKTSRARRRRKTEEDDVIEILRSLGL